MAIVDLEIPIEKTPPLYERVYRVLRNALLTGKLEPGERLTETGVAQWLGVSRTPVREAFRQLQKECLIDTDDNGRIMVPEPDEAELRDLYTCRISLETTAAGRAAEQLTPETVARLEMALKASERAIAEGDIPEALRLSMEFHRCLIEAAGNRWLVDLLRIVWDRITLMRASILRQGVYNREVIAEHWAILDALRAGDAARAVKTLARHLENDLNRYLQLLARERKPET